MSHQSHAASALRPTTRTKTSHSAEVLPHKLKQCALGTRMFISADSSGVSTSLDAAIPHCERLQTVGKGATRITRNGASTVTHHSSRTSS